MKNICLLFVIGFGFFSLYGQNLSDSNTYRVLKKVGKMEIREYRPLLFAAYNDTINNNDSHFRVLADYIFGSNEKNEEIAMTSPVIIRLFNKNEMLFRMPEDYTKESVPKPNNENIRFIKTNSCKKAALSYGGYSNNKKEKAKITELKSILDKNNIQHTNKFELFVYDPPYRLLNRRNEIVVKLIN